MQNKKLFTTLIIAILTFSMTFAFIPMASAAFSIELDTVTGPVGTVVTVSGADATPGLMVEIYWDESLEPEKLLNTTRALGSGDYACEVTIPEATNGEHWIIAFDVTSSTSKGASFTVTPEITLTPTAGLPGDPVTVNGTGFAGESDVKIYFGAHAASETFDGDGGITSSYTVSLANLPVINGSLVVRAFDHGTGELLETFTDNGMGMFIRASDDVKVGSISYTGGSITIEFTEETGTPTVDIVAGHAYGDLTKSVTDESVGIGDAEGTVEFYLDHYLIEDGSETIYLSMTDETVILAGAGVGPYTGNLAKTDVKPKSITLTVTADWAGTSEDVVMTDPDGDGNLESTSDKFSAGTIVYATGAISITFDTEPDAPPTEATADYLYESDITVTLTPDTGKIVFDSAPLAGVEITADYTYYEFYDVTPVAGVTTTTLGSFEGVSITVPSVEYTEYYVTAIDAEGNLAEDTFKVGASITLTPEEGPTGTVITIVGRGFRGTAITTIEIVEIVKSYTVSITLVDEAFETELIFPSAVDMAVGSEYTISVSDDQGTPDTATATFTVTGLPKITVSPKYALPGDPITVEGVNFTQIEGTEVTLTLVKDSDEHPVGTTTTNATGGFKDTFTVPAVTYKTYTLTADDVNVTATTSFTVGMVYAVLSPAKGPTGTQVTATGSGFTAGPVNGTFNDILVFEGTVAGDGTFSKIFTVPTVLVAVYTVTIMDEAGLTFEASFNVTETTTITVTPSAAPVGYTVTVEGLYFTASKGTTVTITLKNATWGPETLTTDPPSVTTNATGGFSCTFTVPALDLGDYVINATDTNDLFATSTFSVVKVYIEMHTRATEYLQGDTVSFYIKSTFAQAVTISIKDPTEYPYGSISIETLEWEPLGDFYVVPYDKSSFTLPNDAVLGTWNWTATVGTETETGLFEVVKKPTLGIILDRLDDLEVKIDGLVSKADDIYVLIDTAKGEVLLKLDELDPILVDIQDRTIVINTTLGEVRTLMEALNLDAINAVITSLNQTIATISSDIGTITVNINDIGLKVDAIDGTVATIKTDLGTMQGTVTSIDDDVATIKTDVGTVKADVSDIGVDVSDIAEKEVTVDLTPVWIAVVFSILAFLAAIAAAYMLRSKLA